jgi:alpha-N-arabinofuranosidase
MAELARGRSLVPLLECPTYRAGDRGDAPALDVSASLAEDGTLGVFIVNRSQTDDATLSVSLADARVAAVRSVQVLSGADPKAANTWEAPNAIVPEAGVARASQDGTVDVAIPRLGFVALQAYTERQ